MSEVIYLTVEQYQVLASRTESLKESIPPLAIRLLHGTTGIQTESGELADGVKRHVFYGKPLDVVNVKEEIGDLMWYVALLCNALELNLGEVMGLNIAKLQKRYPDKYTDELAAEENRDREGERKILEGENKGYRLVNLDHIPPQEQPVSAKGMHLNDVHSLPMVIVKQAVRIALKNGWSMGRDGCLIKENDESFGYAAIWSSYEVNGAIYSVPQWLLRVLMERGIVYKADLEKLEITEAEREPISLGLSGESAVELPPGVDGTTSDSSYDRLCGICKRTRIHRTNSVGICTPCGTETRLTPANYPPPIPLKVVNK